MKYVKYAMLFLLVYIVEANVIDIISIKGITPDIILIYLIFVSLNESQTSATIIGFGAGLLHDVLSIGLLGLSALTKSISCFITSYFQQSKKSYTVAKLAIIFFIISIIHDRIYQFIFAMGTSQNIYKSLLSHSIPKALYTVIVALIINFILYRVIWQSKEL